MKEIYCFINQKGGSGKTTTCLAVFDGLTKKGFKTLLIDLDPQGNSSFSTGAKMDGLSVADFLEGKGKSCIQKTERGNIICVPDDSDKLSASSIKYESLLKALEPIKKDYDYFLIDCPPTLSILTLTALRCATSVIIPCESDEYSLQGLVKFVSITLPSVRQENPKLKISGLLISRFNSRSSYQAAYINLLDEVAKMIETKVFETKIRTCISIAEANATKTSIFDYAPRSNGAKDYTAFINELIK